VKIFNNGVRAANFFPISIKKKDLRFFLDTNRKGNRSDLKENKIYGLEKGNRSGPKENRIYGLEEVIETISFYD